MLDRHIVEPSHASAAPPELVEERLKLPVPAGTVFQAADPVIVEHKEGGSVTFLPPGDAFRASRGDAMAWSPVLVQYSTGDAVAEHDKPPRIVLWPSDAGVPAHVQPAAKSCACCGAYSLALNLAIPAGSNITRRVSVPWRRHTATISSKSPAALVLSRDVAPIWERTTLELRRPSPNPAISIEAALKWWNPSAKTLDALEDLEVPSGRARISYPDLSGDRLDLTAINLDLETAQAETIVVTWHRCPAGSGSGAGCTCCEPETAQCPDAVSVTSAAAALLAAANADRTQLVLANVGPNTAYVCAGASDAGALTGIPLLANQTLAVDVQGGARLRWTAICSATETASVRVLEVSCEPFGID